MNAVGVDQMLTLHEVVRAAQDAMNPNLWDYLVGGSGTESTLRRNRQALDRIAFQPRVLRGVTAVDPSTQLFGHPIRLPVLLGPMGGLDAMGQGGAIAAAQAAAAAQVPFVLSADDERRLEAVAAVAGSLKVMQLQVRGDDNWVDDRVRRAVALGYDAICITLDDTVHSRADRDIANRFMKPWRALPPSPDHDALTWDNISQFKGTHDIPLILKGITSGLDAATACDLGVDAIYVSNYGGRRLDHGAGTLDVLPEVVAAVAGRATVIVDGGISRGSDVVKAIALGAHAVGLGRLYCYGLAAAGAAGITRVLQLLELEVVECLALLGVSGFDGLNDAYLRRAEAVSPPGVLGAFPLLAPPLG